MNYVADDHCRSTVQFLLMLLPINNFTPSFYSYDCFRTALAQSLCLPSLGLSPHLLFSSLCLV